MVASKIKKLLKTVTHKVAEKAEAETETLVEMPPKRLKQLESKLGYTFNDKQLLAQSMTHPSFLLNTKDQLLNNQRLEFLGDAVIQLALTDALYKRFPKSREGKLTATRSGYARGDFMANIARELQLDSFLLLKPKDRAAGVAEQDSALGDAFEALIGAVYLDGGWETAYQLILKLYNNLKSAPTPKRGIANPKGKLQELIQPIHGNEAIRYETTAETGEAHSREFEVTVFCNETKLGVGTGRTKKEAAEKAAIEGLKTFGDNE